MIEPIALFGIQFTFALIVYALAARWYAVPRLRRVPPAAALVPLLWIHVFRIVGGSILEPGSVGPGVPAEFREMVGYGDMVTAALALIALFALRTEWTRAMLFVWVFVAAGMLDSVNAVIQSMRFNVFDDPLGVNWVIVTVYVPALLVSSYLIVVELLRSSRTPQMASQGTAA